MVTRLMSAKSMRLVGGLKKVHLFRKVTFGYFRRFSQNRGSGGNHREEKHSSSSSHKRRWAAAIVFARHLAPCLRQAR